MFVKHVLKVKRYVRYVDAFVLIGDRPEQLNEWREQIERFLADRLHLELQPGYAIPPLSQAVYFLGFVLFPTPITFLPLVFAHAPTNSIPFMPRPFPSPDLLFPPPASPHLPPLLSSYLPIALLLF